MFRFAHVWSLPDQCWCCGICVQKNAVTQCVYVAHSSLWHCQRMNYESCWAERTATKQSQNRHGLSWVLGIWEKIKSEGINRRNKRRWAGLGATQHTLDLKLVTTSWCQKRLILRWHSLQPFVWVITALKFLDASHALTSYVNEELLLSSGRFRVLRWILTWTGAGHWQSDDHTSKGGWDHTNCALGACGAGVVSWIYILVCMCVYIYICVYI